MIEIAEVKEGDTLYDLGCGDGRIVATAAKKFGIKAYGFGIDPQRIIDSTKTVKDMKVEHLVTITRKNIFELDLSPATVITLYLLPSLNVKLIPQLEKCRPGTRIVSHDFDMKGIKPKRIYEMDTHTIYLWVTPLEKE
jgi:ribosomal protein L11 methylase PrmA